MAVPLNTCATIEQRGLVGFLWAKNMEEKISTKNAAQWAAFLCGYPLLHPYFFVVVKALRY
jgi:hypothetical protein